MLITDCEFLFHAELDVSKLDESRWNSDVKLARDLVLERKREFKGKNLQLMIALIEVPACP